MIFGEFRLISCLILNVHVFWVICITGRIVRTHFDVLAHDVYHQLALCGESFRANFARERFLSVCKRT